MAIEPAAALSRRTALTLLAWACAPGRILAKNATTRLAAAWERQGRYHIGLLGTAQTLHVQKSLEVPTRAHGLCMLADGSLVATARRPGDWLVRWHPGRAGEPQWLWQTGTHSFNGHVLASPSGERLYTTETDMETGASQVCVRDIRTLQTIAQWPTHGIDAHELLWDATQPGSPALIVANGGVPTTPETGRTKRDLARMDPSLVRLDAATGTRRGQWRLPDPRLSLRHLAWASDGSTLGIALQAEHHDEPTRRAAPVLAWFDGTALHPAQGQPPLAGYGGSIAATPEGWRVSCPRAGGIALYDPQGTWQGLAPLPDVCALAVHDETLWAGGSQASLQLAATTAHHPHGPSLQGARLDNHWLIAPSA